MREQDLTGFTENARRGRSGKEQAIGLRWLGVVLMLVAIAVCSLLTWKYLQSKPTL